MSTYFISHATADSYFVENQLIPLLTVLRIEFWYSKHDIQTGAQWEKEIKLALHSSDGILLVMTPNSVLSEWVKDELSWALENRPGRVIPIMYKECNLEDFHVRLPRIQFIDFYKDENSARNKLISLLVNIEYDANSRITVMNGVWKGIVHQHIYVNDEPLDYPVEFKLKVSAKGNFNGTVTLFFPVGEFDFKLTGGFLYERFIQFSYYGTDPGIIQFGAAVLELNASGKSMSGKWVGYGAQSQSIVDGEVLVNKMEFNGG